MREANTRQRPALPLVTCLLGLTGMAAAMVPVAAWLCAAVFGSVPNRSLAVGAMAAVVWAASLVAVVPVALLDRRGGAGTVTGYFIGAAIRIAVCLAAALVGVLACDLPAGPVLLTLAVVYVPLLWLESALVARGMWRRAAGAGTSLGAGGAA